MQFIYLGNEDSDQTARMGRLNWAFAGRTYQKVHFFHAMAQVMAYFEELGRFWENWEDWLGTDLGILHFSWNNKKRKENVI